MTDDLETQMRQMLAERAGRPAAPGDPVALVESRMRRRNRRRGTALAVVAAACVAAVAVSASLLTNGRTSTQPTGPNPTPPPTSKVTHAPAKSPLKAPASLAIDNAGNLLIADDGLDQILRRLPSGGLQVVAGTGTAGFSGDGGPATKAEIDQPRGIAVAPDGTIYFGDVGNNRVRAISPSGLISTVLGGTAPGQPAESISGVAVGPDGRLYVAASGEVEAISLNGTISEPSIIVPASSASPNATAPAFDPDALAFDSHGNLYIANFSPKALLRLVPGEPLGTVDSNLYVAPGGLATASDGSVLIADYGHFSLDKISGATVTTLTAFTEPVAGLPQDLRPFAIAAAPDGTIYMADDGEATGQPSLYVKPPNGGWQALSVSTATSAETTTAGATAICAGALADVKTASATTVGDIRGLTIGPGSRPAKDAFSGLPDSRAAAWCWTPTLIRPGSTKAPGSFTCWAVVAVEPAVQIIVMNGLTSVPSGAPLTR